MSDLKLKWYYRVSDKSYPKPKLPGADKLACFTSFAENIQPDWRDVLIIADNASEETISLFSGLQVERTHLGNARSLRYAIEIALAESDADTFVYFAEDDYLYRPGAKAALIEGAGFSDYVTLYDHPDKYTLQYGMGETSQVRRTPSSHWRYTLSTCMTFGVWADTLRCDMYHWKEHTEGDHPNDHQVFADLNGAKRSLAVSIPGFACHTDLTYSGVVNKFLVDTWAVEQMMQKLDEKAAAIQDETFQTFRANLTLPDDPWHRLQLLDAMLKMGNKNGQG